MLKFDRCVRCRTNAKWYRRFDYYANGLVCSNCLKPGENIQSQSFVHLFLYTALDTYDTILEREFNIIDLVAFHIVMINYYENEVGLYIPAFTELKKTSSFRIPKVKESDYL